MANNEEIEIIDWNLVKNRLAGVLNWLGSWYLGAVVFVVPLWILTYGFPGPVIRQLLLFALVGLGVLVWLTQTLWRGQSIIWRSSPVSWGALFIVVAALFSSFLSFDPMASWGLRGGLSDSSPYVWLAVAALMILIVLEAGNDKKALSRILFAYLASSTLLAVFVIVWWITKQELITPALGLFSTSALWFSVNTLVLSAASLLLRGRMRVICLIAVGLHLVVLFGYDFDAAWYLLAAGGLVFSIGQLLFEKHVERVDFKLSFGLIIVSIALLFVPIRSLLPTLGFDSSAVQTVGAGVVLPRYYNNVLKTDPILGVGLGQGSESFWNSAELVDMRQVRQFPAIGSSYLAVLWEGGIFLLGALIFLIVSLAVAIWRSLSQKVEASALNLALVLGFVGWLAILALVPLDGMILFSFSVFVGLASALLSRARRPISLLKGARSFLAFGSLFLLLFWLSVIFFSFYEAQGRLKFLDSVKTDKTGTNVDLLKLDQAVSKHPYVFGYRLARIDFVVSALSEAPTTNPAVKTEQIELYLTMLKDDYSVLDSSKLSGRQGWVLAWDSERIASVLQNLSTKEQSWDEPIKEWLTRARTLYEKSLAVFPRNVIMFTDAARFYRQYGSEILREGESEDKPYRQAEDLLEKTLAIDSSYEPATLERSQLLMAQGKSEEALEAMKSLADKNPAASYNAGHLAFTSQKFDEAIKYFKKAIDQNNNHLQARYELVQVYLATGDNKSANAELAALEQLAPKDDVATQTLLKGLRELVK